MADWIDHKFPAPTESQAENVVNYWSKAGNDEESLVTNDIGLLIAYIRSLQREILELSEDEPEFLKYFGNFYAAALTGIIASGTNDSAERIAERAHQIAVEAMSRFERK